MVNKVAVAVIHGIGVEVPNFADELKTTLENRCREICGDDIIIRPVYWAPVFQPDENELMRRLERGGPLGAFLTPGIRRFMVDFLADAIAYQISPHNRERYDSVHAVFARTLRELAGLAGDTAPLVVIAHSLGTIIASNYLYDLQVEFQIERKRHLITKLVRDEIGTSPLERGETLSTFYTCGSPIALWSLRYNDFGVPILVPSPKLTEHYPGLKGEWINIYDQDDVISSPLKTLNTLYESQVTADNEINVGSILESWNPLSHLRYWGNDEVLTLMSNSLTRVWKYINS